MERAPKPRPGWEGVGAEQAAHLELQKALEARTLAIVGDPGAGKSTFLNRISAALCDAWMGRGDISSPSLRSLRSLRLKTQLVLI